MINIQPFISKLDKLREYINGCIDGRLDFVNLNFEALPPLPVDEIFRIYRESGMLFTSNYEMTSTPVKRLSFDEWYLKFQIEIDVAEMNKVKGKEELPIIITDHAFERAKERIGLSHSALTTKAVKAYNEGISHKETAGNLKKYLNKIFLDEKKANNSKILGEYVFLFRNNTLITVYHVPNNLKKSVHKINKQKQA